MENNIGFAVVSLGGGFFDVVPFGYGEFSSWTPETIESDCAQHNQRSLTKKYVEEVVLSSSSLDEDIDNAWKAAKKRSFQLQE